MSNVRLLPVPDTAANRNFRDIESALNAMPDQGQVGKRWRFQQTDDGAGLRLEYYDGKQWIAKATWP
jgi:hypothetical protein